MITGYLRESTVPESEQRQTTPHEEVPARCHNIHHMKMYQRVELAATGLYCQWTRQRRNKTKEKHNKGETQQMEAYIGRLTHVKDQLPQATSFGKRSGNRSLPMRPAASLPATQACKVDTPAQRIVPKGGFSTWYRRTRGEEGILIFSKAEAFSEHLCLSPIHRPHQASQLWIGSGNRHPGYQGWKLLQAVRGRL